MPHSPTMIRTLDVPLDRIEADWPGLRIAHISDFHFRRWNRPTQAAQDHLMSLDYDILVTTGDFGCGIERWRRPAELTRRFFEPLAERAPVYGVLGNHDNVEMTRLPDYPVRFLRNESVRLTHEGAEIELAGIEQTHNVPGDLGATLEGEKSADLTILLAHYPSTLFRLPPGRVDLQLSGHTHGGQIRLPLVGCVWPNDRIPRRLARGLHRVDGVWLHVSSGIGVSPPVFLRVKCPPEVTILTLRPACEIADKPLGRPAAASLVR